MEKIRIRDGERWSLLPVGEADADECDEIEEAGHAQQGVEPTLVLHTPRNMEIRPRRRSALTIGMEKPSLWIRSGSVSSSGSGVLMAKNCRILQLKKILFF
jgi:hypothetical protein